MKYIVDTIVDEIIKKVEFSSGEVMIRIDCFNNLDIYEQIASLSSEKIFDLGKTSSIKLSSKTLETLDPEKNSLAANSLKSNNWIADAESITYYRNLHTTDVLILMGTENEDDSGGLLNFYEISPTTLVQQLKGNYASIFFHANPDIDVDPQKINNLYNNLFTFKPVDIIKLSFIADKWANEIYNDIDFKDKFFNNLPLWDLPVWNFDRPKDEQIRKKNIFRQPFKFINGNLFKSITASNFLKIKKIVDAYNSGKIVQKNGEIIDIGPTTYNENWDGWPNQKITSFNEYAEILLDFISGNNFYTNREKLLGVDYAITQDVLGLKIPTEKKQKKKSVLKITSEPLTAFLQAIFEVLLNVKESEEEIDEIVLDFEDASITSLYSNTSGSEQLAALQSAWKNICRHTNGVVEYINKWDFNTTPVEIKIKPEDFFSPESAVKYCTEGKIKAQTSAKTTSRINFKICCYKNDQLLRSYNQECVWQFLETSPWLHNFSSIYEANENLGKNCFIPLTTTPKINSLIFSKSEEEFFDLLNESFLNSNFDIIDRFDSHKTDEITKGFIKLGSCFSRFLTSLNKYGFYFTLLQNNNSLVELTSQYKDLGEKIISQRFPETQQWILDAFIHAFLIEKNTAILAQQQEPDCCIVPPWHPAALQKLSNQKVFLLDGFKEWWRNTEFDSHSKKEIEKTLDELNQMSKIQGALDIMPSRGSIYYGLMSSFGSFSVYGCPNLDNENRLKDFIAKDVVFDEDFNESSITQMNDDAKMIYGVLNDYLKAFPNSFSNISLAFINPSNLQPIVASIHKLVEFAHSQDEQALINITLQILVKPENKGGRNYLAYWMDEFFSEDENVNIKTYLNEWTTTSELKKLLDCNNDIAFVMNFLQVDSMKFIRTPNQNDENLEVKQCMFPIVYKPSPIADSSVKRRIELSQPQFSCSFIHTQVVRYKNNLEEIPKAKYIAVRETTVNNSANEIIAILHEKAYWVACIDSGLDGALIKNLNKDVNNKYSIIGFSTGKGSYAQYNITITARSSILNVVTKKFENRLYQLFHWDDKKIYQSSSLCIQEASHLDGISLFSAINQKDQNIREFMAYILTSLREKKFEEKVPLKIIVHLDSYKHWFSNQIDKDEDDSESRPDFLILSIKDDSERIKIQARVVECKISLEANSESHKEKAVRQVEHGLKRLSSIFNPQSTSIKKRYWYSQLYRALVFSNVSFSDDSEEFSKLSQHLRSILDGEFDIEWSGEVLGYWLDQFGENENTTTDIETGVKIHNIPQLAIQSLLLGEETNDYIKVDQNAINEDEFLVNNENESSDSLNVDEQDSLINTTGSKSNYSTLYPPLTPISSDSSSTSTIASTDFSNSRDSGNESASSINNNSENSSKIDLDTIRVLIGTSSKSNEEVYWEFGHERLSNRHLLITGTSGQGKTYAIQSFLYELSKTNISSIIFDYTEGFKPDQLEKEFSNRLNDRLIQKIIYSVGVPINPFVRHEIDVAGTTMQEKPANVATRFAEILSHVYKFGDQQYSAIFKATLDGLRQYNDGMNMSHFQEKLEEIKKENSAAKTVLSKMEPFFETIDFKPNADFNWGNVLYSSEPQVTVFQLTNIAREMQVIITELMLWDAWYYTKIFGNKNKPFVVVLDEAQNLSHKTKSPSASILTEGRKFGWSAWFATQSLNILESEEITRLMQSALKIYFKPTEDEMIKISKQIDSMHSNDYLSLLKQLKKGQCIVIGDKKRSDGSLYPSKPIITDITALKNRK